MAEKYVYFIKLICIHNTMNLTYVWSWAITVFIPYCFGNWMTQLCDMDTANKETSNSSLNLMGLRPRILGHFVGIVQYVVIGS